MKSMTFSLLFIGSTANACMWDRDTLEADYKHFPKTIEAVVGRFVREPPLFYQMRRDRVKKELAVNPNQPDKYDDIAVAESRLGNQDSAIEWMNRKSKLQLTDDQRYRMYSNIGTFRLVKWMQGDHKKLLPILDQGIRDIEGGLRINPHAHFDREPVQLEFMKWAREYCSAAERPIGGLSHRLAGTLPVDIVIKGITGMIVMGYAWNSPDLMAALGSLGPTGRLGENATIRFFAGQRVKELAANRVHGIAESANVHSGSIEDSDGVLADYTSLRKQADAYQRNREAYEIPLLGKGRHPDTDRDFWKSWREPNFVVDLAPARLRRFKGYLNSSILVAIVCGLLSIPLLILVGLVKAARRFARRNR